MSACTDATHRCCLSLFSSITVHQVPSLGPLSSYTAAVEALPLTNSPAVFGLHPNAEIGYYSAATRDMWRDLLTLQPRKPGRSDGPSREETIAQIATDIAAKVRSSEIHALHQCAMRLVPIASHMVLHVGGAPLALE